MITSETFYRAECDVESCAESIPNEDDYEASHWPLASVEKELRETHEKFGVELIWFYDGERVLCPQHHPEARPCSTCGGQGSVKVPGRPPKFEGEWLPAHHWEECPECHWIGFHPAQPDRTQEEK